MMKANEAASFENKSCLLYGPGDARFEDRPIPTITDPKDVIILIKYVGVCGSDVHFWNHGGVRLKVSHEKPLVMGHEATGIVHSVGPGVASLSPGDRIALEPGIPCRTCSLCREGCYNLCQDMKFAAAPPDVHGCLSKFYKLPEDFCYKLPENLEFQAGVLVEPLSVAVHACRVVGIKPGSKVLVFGAGTIGLMSAAVAKAFGAKSVSNIDLLSSRLDFAAKHGYSDFTWVPDIQSSPEDNAANIKTRAKLDLGADVVIETTGAQSSINIAVHALRVGGSFIQVGLGKPSIEFPILRFSEKELHFHGCFRYGPGDFQLAVDLLGSGKVSVGGLITKCLPFEQATEAWGITKRGEGIKTVIQGPER